MPFVQGCNDCRKRPSDGRPAECPASAGLRQSRPPSTKKKQAHDEIANDVPGLADQEMPRLKMCHIHPKKKMEDGEEDEAGIVGTADLAGFGDDDSQPEPGGDPNF